MGKKGKGLYKSGAGKVSAGKHDDKPEEKKEIFDLVSQNIPDEQKAKLSELSAKLEKFKENVLEKFNEYVLGIALLPPSQDEKEKHNINVLVLIDDSDSQKMTKLELKEKLAKIIDEMAKSIDKNLAPETIILTELWQNCFDARYELLQGIAMSAFIYDKGMLSAIKICEVHKTMVLKKFEKYIVSYVLAGSFVQGKPNPHDIDVYIVIDDTDVKKMTRAELKDKLRAIIIGMGIDAGKMTGIEGKLHIQVYILTDFWESMKEAHPVILTFLRDGVPFYDRGIFMPWKQLLAMGRVKPSQESIDMFMHTGDQILERVKFKLQEIATEDIFYATLTPMQAAIMLMGFPPPTPRESIQVAKDLFVEKEKLLEQEYVDILEKIVIKTRKAMEYGDKKTISGKEVDDLVEDAKKYLKRINELFKQIQKLKEEENIVHTYEHILTIVRDLLKGEGNEKVSDKDISKAFETEIIHKGLIPEKFHRIFKELVKAKADYDLHKLSKTDVKLVIKETHELSKVLIEYIQRKRSQELEQAKIRVKYHDNKYGEVLLLGDEAFIIHDIETRQEISRAKLTSNGGLSTIAKSSLEEIEEALANKKISGKTFIKEPIFEDLKQLFGSDVEILVQW
ncbi:MAG: hypothetical protein V1725_07550 [archaeon]